MISMDKKYKTRHGRDVRILCVDGPHPLYPVVGFIGEELVPQKWTRDGLFVDGCKSGKDLSEIRKSKHIVGKIIAYSRGDSKIYSEVFTAGIDGLRNPTHQGFDTRVEYLRKHGFEVFTDDIDLEIEED